MVSQVFDRLLIIRCGVGSISAFDIPSMTSGVRRSHYSHGTRIALEDYLGAVAQRLCTSILSCANLVSFFCVGALFSQILVYPRKSLISCGPEPLFLSLSNALSHASSLFIRTITRPGPSSYRK